MGNDTEGNSHQSDNLTFGIPSTALVLTDAACTAKLVHGTQAIPLNAETASSHNNGDTPHKFFLLVGRTKEADLRIQHGSISRQHALLYYRSDGALVLQDLGGKHGTIVNGQKLAGDSSGTTAQGYPTIVLNNGDSIQFGKVRESIFRVEYSKEIPTTSSTTGSTQEDVVVAPTNSNQLSVEVEEQATTTHQEDQVALEEAGKGLTGREKRQAEIAAMMASLDRDVTYTKVEAEQHRPAPSALSTTTTAAATTAVPKLPPQHRGLPISGLFEIPSSDATEGRLSCAVVDPPGSRIALGRRNSTLSLFDYGGMTQTRREAFATVRPQQTDGQYPLQSVAYSPSGDQLLIGLASVQPIILDRDGQFVLQFARGDMYLQDPSKTIGHTAEVTAVAWHGLEKQFVFTASKDGSVRRWNVETGKLQFEKLCNEHVWVVKSAVGRKTAVTSLALHPSGRMFAVGTSDGSIQIWSTSRARPDKVVVAGTTAITALCYSVDGTKLASRALDESVAKVWKAGALSRSAQPIVTCLGLPTIHEAANIAFSPKADYLVGGASALLPTQPGSKPVERGSLNFYHLADKPTVEPCADMEITRVGPVVVHWHPRWNQIMVGCSDGSLFVYYDVNAKDQSGGIWTAVRQSMYKKRGGTGDDDLQALLRERARQAGPAIAGEILTPFASHPKRRRKDENAEAMAKREPERPASGKHKAGGAGSAVTTFAQYIADQSTKKGIAGKDPREALLKYSEGKSYLGKETKILDTKTMEQEEEEEK